MIFLFFGFCIKVGICLRQNFGQVYCVGFARIIMVRITQMNGRGKKKKKKNPKIRSS